MNDMNQAQEVGKSIRLRRLALWSLQRSKVLRRVIKAVRHPLRSRNRRVPRRLGMTGLFEELDRLGCRYVVLRWFDTLPDIEDGGDLDILIDDDHAPMLDRILTRSRWRGGVECDAYSVHGIPGFSYHRFPHYPPALAMTILERAVRHPSGAMIPNPEDHFLSLAFHALYHKGYRSGLPVDSGNGPLADSPHDYVGVLSSLAAELDLDVPITMWDLDRELAQRGWRPPPDMLMKWAVRNEFCRGVVEEVLTDLPVIDGLTVGLVRELAADETSLAHIAQTYGEWGFSVRLARRLTSDESDRAKELVRGGNWGRGPWPLSGGAPAAIVVAVDPSPTPPTDELNARHPGVDNARVFALKQFVRDQWNEKQQSDRKANIMHSSDNASHAVHYLQLVAPHEIDEITSWVEHQGSGGRS